MLKPEKLIDIQKKIRRGQPAIVKNDQNETKEVTFENFSTVKCPHEYCELHPRREKDRPCQGFMIWRDAEGVESNSCPWIGGRELSVDNDYYIKHWIVQTTSMHSDEVKTEHKKVEDL